MSCFLGILHKIRNDGSLGSFKKNGQIDKNLQFIIKTIRRFLPFVARIHTKTKIFAGLLTKLESKNGIVKFTITDCHANGTSSKKAKTYVEQVSLDDLMEIEPINLSTEIFWALYLEKKEKKQ